MCQRVGEILPICVLVLAKSKFQLSLDQGQTKNLSVIFVFSLYLRNLRLTFHLVEFLAAADVDVSGMTAAERLVKFESIRKNVVVRMKLVTTLV